MTLVISSGDPKFNFPRHYIAGVAIVGAGMTLVAATPYSVLLNYPFPGYQIELVYGDNFYHASSNYYTIDHVFKLSASHFTYYGTEIDGNLLVGFDYFNGEHLPRVWYQVAAFSPTPILIPLPTAAAVWRQLP